MRESNPLARELGCEGPPLVRAGQTTSPHSDFYGLRTIARGQHLPKADDCISRSATSEPHAGLNIGPLLRRRVSL